MDAQAVKAGLLIEAQGDGVIQILGVFSVNGHHQLPAKVQTSLLFFLRNAVRNGCKALRNILREGSRKAVGLCQGQDIHPGIVHMSQDLRDLPFRAVLIVSVGRQPYHHLMALHRSQVLSLRNEDVPGDPLIIRQHKAVVLLLLIEAHKLRVGMLQYPQHPSLGALALFLLFDQDTDLISVHGPSGPVPGDKDVLVSAFHGHEAEASGIPLEMSLKGEKLRLSELTPGAFSDQSLSHQGIQCQLQFLSAAFWHLQEDRQLL